jgi:hypothetical protein
VLFSGQCPTPDDKNLFNEIVMNGTNGLRLSFGDTSKVQVASRDRVTAKGTVAEMNRDIE